MGHRRSLILLTLVAVLAGAGCRAAGESAPVPRADPSSTPAGEPDLVFAVKGDWGAATPQQAAVTARMCKLRRTVPFDVVVTTGDNFSAPDGVATGSNYHSPEACLISHPGHRWRASWGNHDVAGGSTADELGAVERTYTWSAGAVQFFMLDSNRAADPELTGWLEAELEASRAAVKIAVFHHPPFSAGLHPDDVEVRSRWVPLFEQHGVSLVLNGHNHGYEHAVANGVHYVVTGGGGAEIYPCVTDHPALVTCRAVNHFLVVQVTGTRLDVRAVAADGREVDRFEIG